jgi:hypothetical protein
VIPVVYIAGPLRGATAWDVEQNIRRAEEVAVRVARAGGIPICPHANTRFINSQQTDEFWLEGDLEILRRCDGLVVVEGWENSAGTLGEIACAQAEDIPFIFYSGDWDALAGEINALVALIRRLK